MGQPVVHFSISGKDSAALRNFYGAMFDWKIGAPMVDMGNYALIDASSSGIGGGIGDGMNGEPSIAIHVEVPDLQAALDKAVALGGSVFMQPMEVPGGIWLAMFTDPAGNVIGLVKS